MNQFAIEDLAFLLALAKTAKIDAAQAVAVGSVILRVEAVLAAAKLPQAPAAEKPAAEKP